MQHSRLIAYLIVVFAVLLTLLLILESSWPTLVLFLLDVVVITVLLALGFLLYRSTASVPERVASAVANTAVIVGLIMLFAVLAGESRREISPPATSPPNAISVGTLTPTPTPTLTVEVAGVSVTPLPTLPATDASPTPQLLLSATPTNTGAVVTATPVPTPDLTQLAQQELAKLAQGEIVFNPPVTVAQGEDVEVEARIARRPGVPNISTGLMGPGPVQSPIPLRVGRFMGAELKPGDPQEFEIAELGRREQVVSDDGYARWDWRIKAVEAGKKKLYLHVWARITLPTIPEQTTDVALLDKELEVQVNYLWMGTEFTKKNTTVVLSAGAGAAGTVSAFLLKLHKRFPEWWRQFRRGWRRRFETKQPSVPERRKKKVRR